MTQEKIDHLYKIRHTASHALASAVKKLYPDVKLGFGPVIDTGFYYDFSFSQEISDKDLPKIEKEMKKILRRNLEMTGKEVTAEEAKAEQANQPFKHELIDEYAGEGKKLTLYALGDFVDLCKGGHVDNTQEMNPDAIHLTGLAGAYWRGAEKNPMLTRIYAAAFETPEELQKHLTMLEEAKKRDHRKLGPALDLFFFHETSPGMPYWLPKGLHVLNTLIDFWRRDHRNRGYMEVSSPLINKKELFETSGHWEHYQEDMFIARLSDEEIYGVKPMNCPNAMVIFKHQTRSYREFPLRLSDTDQLHRYERAGTLHGLLRVRSFRQDDAHIFVTEDQIGQEYERILQIVEDYYTLFGLTYTLRLGTRPEKFLGDAKTWDSAEKILTDILNKTAGKGKYLVADGDGAFYGPKIDILIHDSLGREWQMGTIQLDFQQPQRFELTYTDDKGALKTPIAIHRVIYGSLERFIGILLEHTAGNLPLWISPVQIAMLPVADAFIDDAKKIASTLTAEGLFVQVDTAKESVGKKIRNAAKQKIPYVIVVGEKEKASGVLPIRKRGSQETVEMTLGDFVDYCKKNIADKSLEL